MNHPLFSIYRRITITQPGLSSKKEFVEEPAEPALIRRS
jgi:hypothetical protein